jgi:hypothetical protein
VRREGVSERAPMVGEEVGVFGAVLVEESRRALDVGEEKRNGAGREVMRAHRPNSLTANAFCFLTPPWETACPGDAR